MSLNLLKGIERRWNSSGRRMTIVWKQIARWIGKNECDSGFPFWNEGWLYRARPFVNCSAILEGTICWTWLLLFMKFVSCQKNQRSPTKNQRSPPKNQRSPPKNQRPPQKNQEPKIEGTKIKKHSIWNQKPKLVFGFWFFGGDLWFMGGDLWFFGGDLWFFGGDLWFFWSDLWFLVQLPFSSSGPEIWLLTLRFDNDLFSFNIFFIFRWIFSAQILMFETRRWRIAVPFKAAWFNTKFTHIDNIQSRPFLYLLIAPPC